MKLYPLLLTLCILQNASISFCAAADPQETLRLAISNSIVPEVEECLRRNPEVSAVIAHHSKMIVGFWKRRHLMIKNNPEQYRPEDLRQTIIRISASRDVDDMIYNCHRETYRRELYRMQQCLLTHHPKQYEAWHSAMEQIPLAAELLAGMNDPAEKRRRLND
ncbi:MAG TPA: hypothetical protein VGT41_01230 [Candidatus Babeliales bacterium]|nr:hypothetical protein [Candidatus Babeliales bacterium]